MRLSLFTGLAAAALAVSGLSGPVVAEEPVEQITPAQAQAVSRLIEVWTFVKYHHPDALAGRLAMDPEFLELYPQIRAAPSVTDADRTLVNWIMQTGFGEACDPCAEAAAPADVALASPTPQWLARMPEGLRWPLKRIYDNRGVSEANFLIHTKRDGGPVVFTNEPDYTRVWRNSDEALWALTLARTWGALQYWFPYRDIMDESPEALLPGAVSDLMQARTSTDYQNAISRFTARAQDGHVNIPQFYRAFIPAEAGCTIPYSLRYIDDELVVDGRSVPEEATLQAGDVLLAIDGAPTAQLADWFRPYIAASNKEALGRHLMAGVRIGPCRSREVAVRRGGNRITASVEWSDFRSHGIDAMAPHFQPGETLEFVDQDALYIRFHQLREADLERLFAMAGEARGVVVDMRGYGRANVIDRLVGALIEEPVSYSRFSRPSVTTPGEFFLDEPVVLQPNTQDPRITVPVAVLIDHSAKSASEYFAMAWRAAGATLIGSRTAGADGDVTSMPLPTGGAMNFSGLGVFYPDKSPTQRIGIVPDIEVRPTIAGFAEGRDEVLERALDYLSSRKSD